MLKLVLEKPGDVTSSCEEFKLILLSVFAS